MKLKNKIIVVTGGSGLLGASIIKKIKLEGGIAINADLNSKDNLETDEIQIDITSETSIKKVVDEIVKKHGRIDGWVNNAYPRTSDWGKERRWCHRFGDKERRCGLLECYGRGRRCFRLRRRRACHRW